MIAKLLLQAAIISLLISSASAFEDADCASSKSVDIVNIQEPIKNIDDYTSARGRALQRAYQEAAARVTGLWVESSSRSETDIQQNLAYQSFNQLDKSELAGFVRPTVTDDSVKKIGDHDAVSLSLTVVVCVPKPDFLAKWRQAKAERERKPPQPVDPQHVEWFDAKSGEPLVWFWKGKNQPYSFFDNKGFHPKNGERLQPVTSKVREEWQAEEARRAQEVREREERERLARLAKEEEEALRRKRDEEQRARLSRAPELCNQLAGNPYDTARPKEVGSASYDSLRADPLPAIEACTTAIQRHPSDPRYRYQLARAYQIREPIKALALLKRLTAERYAAAFDNYGWLLYSDRIGAPNIPAAVSAFRTGIQLGDPDSMDSLANLMIQGRVAERSPGEIERLLQRASQLGHAIAEARLSKYQEDQLARREQQIRDEQARRDQQIRDEQTRAMMFEVFKGVVQGMPRRY